MPRWSGREVDQLRQLVTKVSVAELVRKIGRSRGAVTAKAFELRLSLKVAMHLLANVGFIRRHRTDRTTS